VLLFSLFRVFHYFVFFFTFFRIFFLTVLIFVSIVDHVIVLVLLNLLGSRLFGLLGFDHGLLFAFIFRIDDCTGTESHGGALHRNAHIFL